MATFLLTVLVISFIIRFVAPVVLRWLVGSFLKKQAHRYGQQFGGQNPFGTPPPPRSSSSAPGQVHVDYVPPKQKPTRAKEFKGGEYVDFEEVK